MSPLTSYPHPSTVRMSFTIWEGIHFLNTLMSVLKILRLGLVRGYLIASVPLDYFVFKFHHGSTHL